MNKNINIIIIIIFTIIIFLLGNISSKILDLTNIEYNLILGCTVIVIVTSILIKLGILKHKYITNESETIDKLQVLEINEDKNLRCLKISMINKSLLSDTELFKGIHNTIMNLDEFINFSYNKIIILSVVLMSEKEHSLHSNIFINNDTTFEQYYLTIRDQLDRYNNLQHGYHNEQISRFVIKAWNVDHKKNLKIKQTFKAGNISYTSSPNIIKRSYSTIIPPTNKWYKSLIKPLSIYNSKGELKLKRCKPICTMDLETISINNNEIVISISSCVVFNGFLDNKIFLINKSLLNTNLELAVSELWSNYFKYLEKIISNDSIHKNELTIFAHNLGDFDGYFLYKGLLNYYPVKDVNSLIDESNSFISISVDHGFKFEWKDSLRVFPMSLDKLCKMFLVEGKTLTYNDKFRNIEFFNDQSLLQEFINYSKQDSLILYYALTNAQQIYYDKFKIDLISIYSTATLSLKIFRSHFLDKPIFTLPSNIDHLIRNAYYGGGTDVYKKYGKNLYYYDVNSLYPFVMAFTPMPIGKGKAFQGDIRLINPKAYGYFYCKITCPDNINDPILQRRIETSEGLRTIAGTGTWYGWMYSLEMDNAIKYGYKFEIIKGYEYEKGYIFKEYILTMYNLRQQFPKGDPMNYVAKLLQTSLYGKFGMNPNATKVELFNTNSDEELTLFNDLIDNAGECIKDWIKINDHILVVRDENRYADDDIFHGPDVNVAISSAIVAAGRMWMSQFKNDPNVAAGGNIYYSDTDSIIIDKPLKQGIIGTDLGQFKLEYVIERAVFLAPKVYGFITDQGEEIIKVKGLKSDALKDLHVSDLEELLIKDSSREFNQEKWYKNLYEGNITSLDTVYNLKVTSNKREAIYVNNVFEFTKPYNYKDIIIKNLDDEE